MKNKYPGKICAAIAAGTVEKALAAAGAVEPFADVIEIRLDSLENPCIIPFTKAINKPIIFTNRADWEGGSFSGTEERRLSFLHDAIDNKAAYIDIELKTEDALKLPLIEKARIKGTSSIVSWHSFSSTPSSQALKSILQEQYRSGAKIGKIITMAQNHHDVLRVLDLQNQASELGFPLIAFCMGSAGTVSRVATLNLGGFMTYASGEQEKPTAPGQLPASMIQRILAEMNCDD